ncbi:MAG: restriction endonuclease subunit S [Lactobacillus delbrueckii]|jgi:restriction endonuclease S subunit
MKFEDFIDVRDGTHDSPKAVEDGVYLLTTKGLKNQKIDFEGLKKVSFQDAKKINERSIVEQYDILLSMIGTVGNVYQERKSSVPYVIKNVALLKFHGDKVLSDWIYYYLLSPSGQQQINLRKKGSTQQFISLKDIRNISVDLPSRSEMKLLVKKLNVVNDKILLNEQINDNLVA